MNDVDPMSMTLEEFYDQPEHYFEVDEHCHLPHLGITVTKYGGTYLRTNGKVFFNLKENDDRSPGDEGFHSYYCCICRPHLGVSDTTLLGGRDKQAYSDDPEMLKRAHP